MYFMNEKIVELVLTYVESVGGIEAVESLSKVLNVLLTSPQACNQYIREIANHESDAPSQRICSVAVVGLSLAGLIYRKELAKKEIVFGSRREGSG